MYIHSIYNLIDCGKPHILFLRVIDFPAMDGMNHPESHHSWWKSSDPGVNL